MGGRSGSLFWGFLEKLKGGANARSIFVVAGLLLAYLASCIYRAPFDGEGFYNSDATYQVLLTMQAYDDSDFSVHSFLPIQTFGTPGDRHINNGPSLYQDPSGNSYYLSFSPIGFYAPYLFCKLLRLPLGVGGIYAFNCLLMLVCAALCARLTYVVFRKKALSALSFIEYIFIPEVMMTQGIVYWHHSLSQVLLLLQLLLFLRCSRGNGGAASRAAFLAVSFLYPYAEWTGFVSNVGFAICILISGVSIRRDGGGRKRLSCEGSAIAGVAALGAVTAASGLYYLWRFSRNVPVETVIATLMQRGSARAKGTFAALLEGYLDSYGPMLALLAALVAVAALIRPSRDRMRESLSGKGAAVLSIAALFPLLENAIMTRHAITYTFDRLKFAPFLILALAFAADALSAAGGRLAPAAAIAGVVAASAFGLCTYGDGKVVDFGEGYGDSIALRDYVEENYPDSCIIKRGWRAWGFLQTMYHRNILCTGLYTDQAIAEEMEKRGCRYAVYLSPSESFWDTGVYDGAEVLDAESDTVVELSSRAGEVSVINSSENDIVVASSLTNEKWTDGIRNPGHKAILFENKVYLLKRLENARAIVADGVKFKIKAVKHNEKWIKVLVNKDASACAYPNELRVR